jgi:hypothetical protein
VSCGFESALRRRPTREEGRGCVTYGLDKLGGEVGEAPARAECAHADLERRDGGRAQEVCREVDRVRVRRARLGEDAGFEQEREYIA